MTSEYLAGLIDGEGCISAQINRAGNNRVVLQVTISNTIQKLLDHVRWSFGGALHLNGKRSSVQHKQGYNLTWSEQEACRILRMVLPHLVIKRAQAEIVLELGARKKANGHKRLTQEEKEYRWAQVAKCHALNKKGPDA